MAAKRRATEMLVDPLEEFSDICQNIDEKVIQGAGVEKKRSAYQHNLLGAINTLRREDFLCDVTLGVGPEKDLFRAHKIVLAGFSEYFKAMFSAGMKESTQSKISLPSVDAQSMAILLDFIYSGDLGIVKENGQKIAIIANFFGCDQFVDFCCDVMAHTLNVNNSVRLLQYADQFNLKALRTKAKDFVLDHLEKIYRSNIDLFALPFPLLIELMQSNKAVLCDNNPSENEMQIFTLLMNVINKEPEDRKVDMIIDILSAARLPCLDDNYFDYVQTKLKVKDNLELHNRFEFERNKRANFRKGFVPISEGIPHLIRSSTSVTLSIQLSVEELKPIGHVKSRGGNLNGILCVGVIKLRVRSCENTLGISAIWVGKGPPEIHVTGVNRKSERKDIAVIDTTKGENVVSGSNTSGRQMSGPYWFDDFGDNIDIQFIFRVKK